jgi:hypothetical protein
MTMHQGHEETISNQQVHPHQHGHGHTSFLSTVLKVHGTSKTAPLPPTPAPPPALPQPHELPTNEEADLLGNARGPTDLFLPLLPLSTSSPSSGSLHSRVVARAFVKTRLPCRKRGEARGHRRSADRGGGRRKGGTKCECICTFARGSKFASSVIRRASRKLADALTRNRSTTPIPTKT